MTGRNAPVTRGVSIDVLTRTATRPTPIRWLNASASDDTVASAGNDDSTIARVRRQARHINAMWRRRPQIQSPPSTWPAISPTLTAATRLLAGTASAAACGSTGDSLTDVSATKPVTTVALESGLLNPAGSHGRWIGWSPI